MSRNAQLRKLAEQLPPAPKFKSDGSILTTQVLKYGHEILEKIPDASIDGKPLDAKSRYLQRVPVMANHFKELNKLVKSCGKRNPLEVIDAYVKRVYAYHNKQAHVEVEQAPTL